MVNATIRKYAASILLAAAGITSAIGCKKDAAPHNNFHPYEVQHAILHFQYYGSVRGTEDLFFDNFGSEEAKDEHSELIDSGGFKPKFMYSIKTGSTITIVDSARGQCVRFSDPTMDSILSIPENAVPTAAAQSTQALQQGHYQRVGDTTILGLPVQVWRQGDHRSYAYLWRYVVVGRRVDEGSHPNELRLVAIDTVTPVDHGKFVPPANFPVRNLPPPPKQPNH